MPRPRRRMLLDNGLCFIVFSPYIASDPTVIAIAEAVIAASSM